MERLRTFGEVYDNRNNAFDILRFILASMVIYSHSYPLLYGTAHGGDILERITGFQVSFGSLAVCGFMVISGFLITQSYFCSHTLKRYVVSRCLRVLPAFAASLLLTAFLIGPWLSGMDWNAYLFSGGAENPGKFVLLNLSFNVFGYSWGVQDVFAANPFPGSANGSMWTLKHEIAMYLLLPLCAYFLFFQRRYFALFFGMVFLGLAWLNVYDAQNFSPQGRLWWVLKEYNSFIKLASFFWLGAIGYIFRDKIIHSWRLVLLAVLVLIFANSLHLVKYAMFICLPYLLLAVAVGCQASWIRKYGDFSYGIYIYAFPVQQTLIALFKPELTVWTFCLSAFVVTVACAAISWHVLEKPALNLKNRF